MYGDTTNSFVAYMIDGTIATACGQYSFISNKPWLILVPDVTDPTQVLLKIKTNDESFVGEHQVMLSIGLKDFPDVKEVETDYFIVTLHKIDQPIIGDQTYNIFSGPFQFIANEIYLSPVPSVYPAWKTYNLTALSTLPVGLIENCCDIKSIIESEDLNMVGNYQF